MKAQADKRADEAVEWLVANWAQAINKPLTVTLKDKFGLGRAECPAIIARAIRQRQLGGAQ
ncbi:hypothetical protein [Pelagibacterium luteolum]|uniref:Uncharacterized protein n=1 Tax=Pelagibacterium luteolum TaxID=440168 RepID=A0A1G7S759_9HYPH|nr:hypothetical protein [Pelagibacterium luteolum]SDG18821.1 hypothetical protein SAMN04487974_101342 [Pelagibacterium luteolum]